MAGSFVSNGNHIVSHYDQIHNHQNSDQHNAKRQVFRQKTNMHYNWDC